MELGDFLSKVQDELRPQRHAMAEQPRFLDLSLTRTSSVALATFGNCLSRGKLAAHASIEGFSSLRQSFSYSFAQLQLASLSSVQSKRIRRWDAVDWEAKLKAEEEEEERLPDGCTVNGKELRLRVPLNGLSGVSLSGLANVLQAWTKAAAESLAAHSGQAAAVGGVPLLQAAAQAFYRTSGLAQVTVPAGLPLKLGTLGSFLAEETLEQQLSTHVGLFSLTSAVLFIGSLRGLGKHSTAQQGNLMGIVATALGILSVLASPGFNGAHLRFFTTFLLAGTAGYCVAMNVQMEDMPQLVAGFHSFVGLAAVFAGFASFFDPSPFSAIQALETFVGTAIGALTFTGSVVAAGKLHGVIPGRPLIHPNRWLINSVLAGSSVAMGAFFANPAVYSSPLGTGLLVANSLVWGGLGANMVLPIGGADMPVVVSLLNACSGLATSAAGFMLSNNLLTITGALVASSGTLLSDIMCRGINRSMTNVLLGGFGTEGGTAAAAVPAGDVHEISAVGLAGVLFNAKRVVIVPGYGLAVARAQHGLADIVSLLRKHGVIVHFAIHPVAGRLPGHMNVLLAEADVPYDIVREMDEINAELSQYDVGIVVGANDIVNPATQTDPNSPIYGMPAIEVWKCKTCVVLKRSMGTGYSGVDNPLFYLDNVKMLFGDAKHSVDHLSALLEEGEDSIQGLSEAERARSAGLGVSSHEEQAPEYPPAVKVLGILRERRAGEQRVSMTPSSIPRLRKMGFSVLLEAGAGTLAGFSDDDYVKQGGVQVAESAIEVLQNADVVLKANEPMLDEVQVLKKTQTLVGFWNMFGTEDLMEALGQSVATFVNLALVPRVSRAQKLDALTSMANIAGYRAVLDAFHRFPRFSRSSVTACGAVPPARVFVIGVGVAGLSAIATAHSLGAKVLANDVREAAKEQVESMGAEFIPVDARGIEGEGAGGYASEMGEDFHKAQVATYARIIKDVDIVITTAMIPNRKAPVLITQEMVNSMKRGSIIIDLAAQTGGNCELTQADKVVTSSGGVVVVGDTNYPSSMPAQASELLGNNFIALLETLGGGTNFGGEHWQDPIIKPAAVVHEGKVCWPPAPTAPAPPAEPSFSRPAGVPEPPLAQPPPEANAIVKWLDDHKEELALAVGGAVVLGLGLNAQIPDEELMHIGYFVLSSLIGHFTVAGVTPALHTPLISVTNAISGIIVVGGMLQLSGPILSARVGCALAAVFLSSVNIVGGFAVTQRMLEMFREDKRR